MKKINEKFTIINEETGEIYDFENTILLKEKPRITKYIIDKMLETANNPNDIDSGLLYLWLKITKQVNEYGQFQVLGAYRDRAFEKEILKDITITGYIMRIIDLAHDFSGILMKNRQTSVKGWTELWECIDCKNSTTQRKIKNTIISMELIREYKCVGKNGLIDKKLILNPFLIRKASYSSQLSIMMYKDKIKAGSNLSIYIIRFLQATGYIS